MNFLAHAYVARLSGRTDPLYVLGAVLPDLATMAGVRLHRHLLDGPVADGVRCHLAADEQFHAHAAFRRGSAAIRRDLTAAGLRSGPARALGHVGWELLADSTLVATPTEDAYWEALDQGEQVEPALQAADRTRWEGFLAHRDRRPELSYGDPSWVAERVFSMLARRPRLSFPRAELPAVTAVLETHLDQVAHEAAPVLADISEHWSAQAAD